MFNRNRNRNSNSYYSAWIPENTLPRSKKVDFEPLIFAWGNNQFGTLGNITDTSTNPEPIKTFTSGVLLNKTVTNIYSKYYNSAALSSEGLVYTWGRNNKGQLGDGTTSTGVFSLPTGPVLNLTNVTDLDIGQHMLALLEDKTVKSWGNNQFGQLGDGTQFDRSIPVDVIGLTDVSSISAGSNFSGALKTDNTLWTWGSNSLGELGHGTVGGTVLIPTQVTGGIPFTKYSSYNLSAAAIDTYQTVYTWGTNTNGILGLGMGSAGFTGSPTQIPGLTGIVDISVGGFSMLSLDVNGIVKSWGNNIAGQLGIGIYNPAGDYRDTPVSVTGLPTNIILVKAGYNIGSALTSDGEVYVWGEGNRGTIGDGNSFPANATPVLVNTAGKPFGYKISQLGGGSGNVLALPKP